MEILAVIQQKLQKKVRKIEEMIYSLYFAVSLIMFPKTKGIKAKFVVQPAGLSPSGPPILA